MSYEGQAAYIEPEMHDEIIEFVSERRHAERNTAILELAYRTGARCGTIAGLLLSDILNKDGSLKEVVVIRSAISKRKKVHKIYLTHPRARKALLAWLKVRPASEVSNLFVNQKGGGFTPNTLSRCVWNIYQAFGLEGASLHSNRRAFITNIIHSNPGIDLFSVQRLAGHSSINTTALYFHSDEKKLAGLVKSA